MLIKRRSVLITLVGAVILAISYELVDRGIIRLNYPSNSTFPVRGVDISHHQGVVDWSRMAGDGVHFAYIKASEGHSFKDDRFAPNWAGARQAGIVPGAYHFYSLCKSPDLQAANFLASAPPAAGVLPPAVDLEFGGNCDTRPDPESFRRDLEIFLRSVEKAWQRPVLLYVTPEFYPEYVKGYFPDNPLWVRSIFSGPRWAGFGSWEIWQYANRGHVQGVSTFVDLNVYTGSHSSFNKLINTYEEIPLKSR
jgi:lysozyme